MVALVDLAESIAVKSICCCVISFMQVPDFRKKSQDMSTEEICEKSICPTPGTDLPEKNSTNRWLGG